MTPYRGISILEPWSMLIRLGLKSIETRTWATAYRGPLLVHASKDTRLAEEWLDHPVFAGHVRRAREEAEAAGRAVPPRVLHPGCVVAVARLAACTPTEVAAGLVGPHELAFGDYTPGRWAWHLVDVTPLPRPVPHRGMLGLWHAPSDLCRAVDAQLSRRDPGRYELRTP